MPKKTVTEIRLDLGRYPNFKEYVESNFLDQDRSRSAPRFPAPMQPNTMDKLAMMQPDDLAKYALSVCQRQQGDASGGRDHIITDEAWEKMFGTNVFRIMMSKKILVRGQENGWMINQAYLV